MPTYTYECENCEVTDELNVPIAERDNQNCPVCTVALKRKITFTGLTWAPTAGGMR